MYNKKIKEGGNDPFHFGERRYNTMHVTLPDKEQC